MVCDRLSLQLHQRVSMGILLSGNNKSIWPKGSMKCLLSPVYDSKPVVVSFSICLYRRSRFTSIYIDPVRVVTCEITGEHEAFYLSVCKTCFKRPRATEAECAANLICKVLENLYTNSSKYVCISTFAPTVSAGSDLFVPSLLSSWTYTLTFKQTHPLTSTPTSWKHLSSTCTANKISLQLCAPIGSGCQ